MSRLEQGTIELEPTDKNYKVYVRNSHGEDFRQSFMVNGALVTSSSPQAKFYFQHLTVEQCKRFVELYNERKLQFGYPGDFYVAPFFLTPTRLPPQLDAPTHENL